MSKLPYNIIEYIMITVTFLSLVFSIIVCVFLVKKVKKLTSSKVIVYTYRIGQRPTIFDIKNLNIFILLLKNEVLLSLFILLVENIKIVFSK